MTSRERLKIAFQVNNQQCHRGEPCSTCFFPIKVDSTRKTNRRMASPSINYKFLFLLSSGVICVSEESLESCVERPNARAKAKSATTNIGDEFSVTRRWLVNPRSSSLPRLIALCVLFRCFVHGETRKAHKIGVGCQQRPRVLFIFRSSLRLLVVQVECGVFAEASEKSDPI